MVSEQEMSKTGTGNFFEDFRVGQLIQHATPRTLSAGDGALYQGLFGARFAVQSSDAFAQAIGYPRDLISESEAPKIPDCSLWLGVVRMACLGVMRFLARLHFMILMAAMMFRFCSARRGCQDRNRHDRK